MLLGAGSLSGWLWRAGSVLQSLCAGFSLWRLGWLWSAGSRLLGLWLWHMGSVVPRRVGSSQTRDGTCVPCLGRQILSHWTTREVQLGCFLILSCVSCFYILEINSLLIASFANIFSYSVGCFFVLFMIFLCCAEAFY